MKTAGFQRRPGECRMGLCLAALLLAGVVAATPVHAMPVQQPDTVFEHSNHESVACFDCHAMESQHGELLVRESADCRGCHHTGQRLERGCAACHDAATTENVAAAVSVRFSLSVRDAPIDRDVVFDHAVHVARGCRECHVGGPSFSAEIVDCRSCHEEHHQSPGAECWACHQEPSADAHPLEVHLSCSGAGCHIEPPVRSVPDGRDGCLWCHGDQAEHQVGRACTDCHVIGGAVATGPSPGSETGRVHASL